MSRRISVGMLYVSTMVFLLGCSSKPPRLSDVVTIATFNIGWLGDGSDDDKIRRSEDDYRRIAAAIEATNADIIGLEEIENSEAVRRVLKYTKEYTSLAIGSSARQQNVGVIYKNTLTVQSHGEYMPVATRVGRNRPGYVVECRKGNFDWLMMVVHLKSTSRADSTDQLREESFVNRQEQSAVLSAWIDSVARVGKERDVMIIGDFNDSPNRIKRPTLTALMSNPNITFVTKELGSCKSSSWLNIDHVLVSSATLPRVQAKSVRHVNLYTMFRPEEVNNVSDHCPVVVQFDTSLPDND